MRGPIFFGGAIDGVNRAIMEALQKDGRLSNLALARSLRVSPSAMLGRVRRLQKSGAIRGFRAVLDPKAVGVGVQAVVAARLKEHSKTCIGEFEAGIREVVGVRACYHVTGQFDMVMLLAVRDLDHLSELIRSDIASIPGVVNLETMLVLAESVIDDGWPIYSPDDECVSRSRATSALGAQ
jgi:Lrp/AsnC family leucine-responsive transcriptional regulator